MPAKSNRSFSSIVDSVVGAFSPRAQLRRMQYRQAIGILSAYAGASRERPRDNWIASAGSADKDLLPELDRLRARTRDLVRNDPNARAIIETAVMNDVGAGITLRSRVNAKAVGMTDAQAEVFQREVEDLWDEWCKTSDCGERLDFYEVQELVDRQHLENGEVLVNLPRIATSPTRRIGLTLEVIEADRLSTPIDMTGDPKVRYGIELGERGEPVAYWVRRHHPNDVVMTRGTGLMRDAYLRVPAVNAYGQKNILHLYNMRRAGQTRGEPWFAPVISYFKDLGGYMEAEVIAARVAACFAVVIKKTDGYMAAISSGKDQGDGTRSEELSPGMFEYLEPGEDVSTVNPSRPSSQFDPFVDRVLHSVCSALGLPYVVVAKDFRQVNYSSARAALLEARRFFKTRQNWMGRKLCQPVYEQVIEEAYLRGLFVSKIADFTRNRMALCRSVWVPQGWGWVDPKNEIEASLNAIKGNISTYADECAAQGRDVDEVFEQRAREDKKLNTLGLPLAGEGEDKPFGQDKKERNGDGNDADGGDGEGKAPKADSDNGTYTGNGHAKAHAGHR